MKFRILTAIILVTLAGPAAGFCGFYVAKADTELFNKASKVVLVRDGRSTTLTMANDFRGDPEEFAVVIPVPTSIGRNQIEVVDKAVIDHLDAYSAPRLVEYFDRDPCEPIALFGALTEPAARGNAPRPAGAAALGVKIEAQYSVGEYDILILAAEESEGLETWLTTNGYRIPDGASTVLGSYIKQDMRFFVAKVNLERQARAGFTFLRPLRVAYKSRKFMLPIRLGTVNADGPQELFVYALGRNGRIETTNYRTVKLPTNVQLPIYTEDVFADFYRDMFARSVAREDMRVVFLEYFWDMGWCDPCPAEPLTNAELRELGIDWLDGEDPAHPSEGEIYLTRLHLRYTAEKFPADLVFQETGDRKNFQARYVLRHPWSGEPTCDAAVEYLKALPARQEQWNQNLATLTGWPIETIRQRAAAKKPKQRAAE